MAFVDMVIFFLLGIGALLPWNVFITESGFFMSRLSETQFAATFESIFGIVYNSINLVAILSIVIFGAFVSERILVLVPYVLTCLLFIAMAVMATDAAARGLLLFYLSLFFVFLCGCCASPLVSGLTSMSAKFPRKCSSFLFSGQAFAGVVTSVSSLATTAASPRKSGFCSPSAGDVLEDDSKAADWGVFAYFMVAACVSFACVLLYFVGKSRESKMARILQTCEENKNLSATASMQSTNKSNIFGDDEELSKKQEKNEQDLQYSLSDVDAEDAQCLELGLPTVESWTLKTVLKIQRVVLFPCAGVVLNFMVTLSVFPAVVALVRTRSQCSPGSSRFENDLFVPILFLTFNTFDLIGRFAEAFFQPFKARMLFVLSTCRVVLIPLFMLMNVKGTRLPIVFWNESWPIIFCALCGLTNGYIATACIVYASRILPAAHRSVASTLAVMGLTLGLLLGSLLSYLVVFIIQG